MESLHARRLHKNQQFDNIFAVLQSMISRTAAVMLCWFRCKRQTITGIFLIWIESATDGVKPISAILLSLVVDNRSRSTIYVQGYALYLECDLRHVLRQFKLNYHENHVEVQLWNYRNIPDNV